MTTKPMTLEERAKELTQDVFAKQDWEREAIILAALREAYEQGRDDGFAAGQANEQEARNR